MVLSGSLPEQRSWVHQHLPLYKQVLDSSHVSDVRNNWVRCEGQLIQTWHPNILTWARIKKDLSQFFMLHSLLLALSDVTCILIGGTTNTILSFFYGTVHMDISRKHPHPPNFICFQFHPKPFFQEQPLWIWPHKKYTTSNPGVPGNMKTSSCRSK